MSDLIGLTTPPTASYTSGYHTFPRGAREDLWRSCSWVSIKFQPPNGPFFKGPKFFRPLEDSEILDTSWYGNFGPWLLCCQQSVDILPNGRAKMQQPREKTAALTADDPGCFSRRKQTAISMNVFKLNGERWTRQSCLRGS